MNKAMQRSIASPALRTIGRQSMLAEPALLIGIAIGFTPVLAGLIFRTYGYHVAPPGIEVLRQLDVPFILIEIAVIVWARGAGLRFRQTLGHLDRPALTALAIYLATFWISSAIISPDPGYSLLRASFWLVHIAFGVAVYQLCATVASAQLKRCGAAIFAGLFVFVPLMAVHLMAAPDPATVLEGKIIWSSAIPGCLSVRHLGIWAALVLACALGALYTCDAKTRGGWLVFATIFLASGVLFWSGTRAGVYGILAGIAVVFLALRSLPSWRILVIAGVAAACGIALSELLLPPDNSFGIFARANVPQSAGFEGFSSGRTVLWSGMMQAFAQSPLFGVGEGAVHWVVTLGTDRHVQPHNSIVQMLSSWGIIACVAAGYLMTRLLLCLHRSIRSQLQLLPLVLMIDCLLIMSLVDGVLYFSRFIMWFAGATAIALALIARAGPAAEAPPAVAT